VRAFLITSRAALNVASPKAPSRRAIVKVAGALAAGIAAPAFLRARSIRIAR